MSSSLALTVGLPVFNGERFLGEALMSILGQTYADFRLVVRTTLPRMRRKRSAETQHSETLRVVYVRHETNRGAAWNYNPTCSSTVTHRSFAGQPPTTSSLRPVSSGARR